MKKYIIISLILISILSSCEKVIEIDYNSVDKQYVISGYTDEFATKVSITQTSNMEDVIDTTRITSATITITDNQGSVYNLTPDKDGFYSSTEILASTPGDVYKIDVLVDGEHFTSSAQLMPRANILGMDLNLFEIQGEVSLVTCSVIPLRVPEVNNYYMYALYHNDIEVTRNVAIKVKEDVLPTIDLIMGINSGEEIFLFANPDVKVVDGDEITINLFAIDENSYKYFNSLYYESTGTNSNVVSNFTGGCLGYYATYLNSIGSVEVELDDILK